MNENKYGSRELPPQNPKSQKYGQTINVRPLTPNRGFQFTARWLNLDLEVYYNDDDGGNNDSQIYPY